MANFTVERRAAVGSAAPGALLTQDRRFRSLVGRDDWARLPALVRQRFARRPGVGTAVTYQATSGTAPLGLMVVARSAGRRARSEALPTELA